MPRFTEMTISRLIQASNPYSFVSSVMTWTIRTGPPVSSIPFPVVTRSFSPPRIAPPAFQHAAAPRWTARNTLTGA